jgi:hypothetical protein
MLLVRALACFCASCFEKDWEGCLNQSHVPEWRFVKIYPKDTQFVCANMEEDEEVGRDGVLEGQDLGNLLQIGDNFAILAKEGNEEGIGFYVLQCQKAKYMVQEAFTCS